MVTSADFPNYKGGCTRERRGAKRFSSLGVKYKTLTSGVVLESGLCFSCAPPAPAGAPPRAGRQLALSCTWDRLAYASQPFAKKVASALALFAPLGTKLAHSARVRTIKHRLERWKPLECPRRAAPTAAKECFGERGSQRLGPTEGLQFRSGRKALAERRGRSPQRVCAQEDALGGRGLEAERHGEGRRLAPAWRQSQTCCDLFLAAGGVCADRVSFAGRASTAFPWGWCGRSCWG